MGPCSPLPSQNQPGLVQGLQGTRTPLRGDLGKGPCSLDHASFGLLSSLSTSGAWAGAGCPHFSESSLALSRPRRSPPGPRDRAWVRRVLTFRLWPRSLDTVLTGSPEGPPGWFKSRVGGRGAGTWSAGYLGAGAQAEVGWALCVWTWVCRPGKHCADALGPNVSG